MSNLNRQPAISFVHFVQVEDLNHAQNILAKYPDRFPEYEIDTGAWRDYATESQKGVEFPVQDEAVLFMNYYLLKGDCIYRVRKPQG